ncbi:MAG TPA: hypothetical protein VLB07_03380 [Woeseiaceae bacterium]|nr:hypothetical protein [Woeseiaceae bacterium]
MILRRVTEHVKAQNWFAVGLDFIVVVVGVFVGLQAQDWAGARAQAELHQRYYERLQADFESIGVRIDSHLEAFEQQIAGAEYVIDLVRMPDEQFRLVEVDEPRLTDALSILTEQRIPPGRSATYVEMLSASQLSSLRNAALRDKLAEYDRLCDIHLEVFRATGMNNNDQLPALYRHLKIRTIGDPERLSGIRSVVYKYDLEGMRTDPEFETAIMILDQSTRNNLGVRKRERALTNEILALLARETAR